ncbi:MULTISPECIES: hypothetical protein [Hyphomonas]|uniref:hypothetical protein n=1 Tax=Hyphomonas TaxID=85 RepID=UPI0035168AA6
MRVCIFGLPKTGTTGLYGLIKGAMNDAGLAPVCSFEPTGPAIYENFFERARPETNFLTKAMVRDKYFKDSGWVEPFSHKVMIVRDPRDRAISRTLFRALAKRMDDEVALQKFIELLRRKEADPQSISLWQLNKEATEIGVGSSEWKTLAARMESQIDILERHGFTSIYYEDFVAERHEKLAEYLGLPVHGADATNANWLDHITRSKGSGDWRNWLTKEDVSKLRPIFKPFMDHFGYEDDWDLPDEQHISPSKSSEYVAKKHAARTAQFELMDSEGITALETDEDLEFFIGRAEDGRIPDIVRVGAYYESKGDPVAACTWYEIGHLYGNEKSSRQLQKLLKAGQRPAAPKSKLVDQMVS